MMTMGTPSGVASAGSLVGGSTGGGESGNDSVAAAVIRLVLPTPCGRCSQLVTNPPKFVCDAPMCRQRRRHQWQWPARVASLLATCEPTSSPMTTACTGLFRLLLPARLIPGPLTRFRQQFELQWDQGSHCHQSELLMALDQLTCCTSAAGHRGNGSRGLPSHRIARAPDDVPTSRAATDKLPQVQLAPSANME